MNTTPVSLLEKLRQPNPQDAWTRFVHLYSPLLYHWARQRFKLNGPDVEDFVQEVFTLLLQELPEFQYNAGKRFRAWLWTVSLNKHRQCLRRSMAGACLPLDAQADLAIADQLDADIDAEYQQHVMRRALQLIQNDFEPATWQAFWECTMNDRSPQEVATEVGLSISSVYAAKSRVLRRLRTELKGFLD
jgi:RNA polymerase sigma-70 factor (ECF subfamily)